MDSISIFREARVLGSIKKLVDVEVALTKYNLPNIVTKCKRKYRAEVWDKKTPINGVPSNTIISSFGAVEEVYLIYRNNQLIILQPYMPNESGMIQIPTADVTRVADAHIMQLATADAENEIAQEVLREMLI